MRVLLVPILVLAAGCGAAPGTEPGPALRPTTVEEMRALVRPFVSSADASGAGAGVLSGAAPRLLTAVSFVGPDGKWHTGCVGSEAEAEALVLELRKRQ